ncbi:MAG: hypothetical protein RL223_3084 [Pseudomonadota bacterium]
MPSPPALPLLSPGTAPGPVPGPLPVAPPGCGTRTVAWRCAQHRADTLEDHLERLGDWQLDYQQLGRGHFHGRLTELRVPGLQVFAEHTSHALRQRGLLGADSLGLALRPRAATAAPANLSQNGCPVRADELLAVHDGEVDLRTPDDCLLLGVVAETAALDHHLARHGLDRQDLPALRPGTVAPVSVPPATREHLQRVLWQALTGLQPMAEADADTAPGPVGAPQAEAVFDALCDALLGLSVPQELPRGRARQDLVDRATACMLAQMHEDQGPQLGAIAARLGASPRTLAYAFDQVLGLSPMQYLRTLRLNLARRALVRRRADESIYDIATRHGFWHFGRFSGDYRRQFGQSPSQTPQRDARAAPLRAASSPARRPSTSAGAPAAPA